MPVPPLPVIDPESGELREASIFVAVLGASSYTYAEATWTRDLYDWIGSHIRAFEFFGGVSEAVVPDNWRTAVTKACWYEPDLNPTYRDLAEHYDTVILPARVRKPRDKAKVEVGFFWWNGGYWRHSGTRRSLAWQPSTGRSASFWNA